VDLQETLGTYMRRRLAQHGVDNYMGVTMSKFPEDLRTYEHFMWEMRANVVVELGVQTGGATRWFRDRLTALGGGTVVAVDINPNPGLPEDVKFIQADVRDPALPDLVAGLLPAGSRPFVVEDTAHTYETTLAALEGFHRFVPSGGYMVIEDGVVDIDDLRISQDWPRGVQPAVTDWLATHPAFSRVDPLYGVTCHPGGFLQADREPGGKSRRRFGWGRSTDTDDRLHALRAAATASGA
jgi:cephalosporin hydroxylase